MSTIIQEKPADVVVMGLGVMSGTIAAQLSLAGHSVVGITRGPYWNYANDFASNKYDEWGIGFMRKWDFPATWDSPTMRNTTSQFAMPIRRGILPNQWHSLGNGVGGAAQHYGGNMGRQGPWAFQMASMTASKYGADFLSGINPNNDVEDWPWSYDVYEPYYVAWEQEFGLCGNGNGADGLGDGKPMAMSKNYPMPGHPSTPLGSAFQAATEALGYSPFPHVTSLASAPYMNPYGVPVNACVYDGWCGSECNYACETGAKANSAFRSIPAAIKTGKFTMVLNSEVTRLDTNADGTIKDVRYYDQEGNIHVQPGTVFFNGLWGFEQTRFMLLSGVGVPYNPANVTGTVGRGLTYGYSTYLSTGGPSGTLPIGANGYPAGNASGGGFDLYDFMDDNFDHTGLDFIGGAQFSSGDYAGSGPGNLTGIAGSSSPTRMGSSYKASIKDTYLRTSSRVGLGGPGPDLANTTSYWDLDPTYVDAWGDPVARITHDWTPNNYNAATYFGTSPGNKPLIAILQKMGCTNISDGGSTVVPPFSAHTDYWGHHWRGGNRVGKSATTSTFNGWQQCWAAPNLFAAGEVNNTTGDTVPSGTHVAGPQVEIASEAMQMYLNSPGVLVTTPDGKAGPF